MRYRELYGILEQLRSLRPGKCKLVTEELDELVCIEAHEVVGLFKLSDSQRKSVSQIARVNPGLGDAYPVAIPGLIPVQSIEDLKYGWNASDVKPHRYF